MFFLMNRRLKTSRVPILIRVLSYDEHLIRTAAKLKTRNNIIQKLANSEWGADTNTLALTRSVTDYSSPVCLQSAHTNKINTQLNSALRIITGTVKSTLTQWLPVLSNLSPPSLHRCDSLIREWSQSLSNTLLPLYNDIYTGLNARVKSRNQAVGLPEN